MSFELRGDRLQQTGKRARQDGQRVDRKWHSNFPESSISSHFVKHPSRCCLIGGRLQHERDHDRSEQLSSSGILAGFFGLRQPGHRNHKQPALDHAGQYRQCRLGGFERVVIALTIYRRRSNRDDDRSRQASGLLHNLQPYSRAILFGRLELRDQHERYHARSPGGQGTEPREHQPQ